MHLQHNWPLCICGEKLGIGRRQVVGSGGAGHPSKPCNLGHDHVHCQLTQDAQPTPHRSQSRVPHSAAVHPCRPMDNIDHTKTLHQAHQATSVATLQNKSCPVDERPRRNIELSHPQVYSAAGPRVKIKAELNRTNGLTITPANSAASTDPWVSFTRRTTAHSLLA